MNSKHITLAPLTTLAIFTCLLISCSDKEEKDPTANNELAPIELTSKTRSFVDEGNRFAFRLLQKVAETENGNFVISPLGVSLAFGIALEAEEDGEAMEEACKVLGFESGSKEEIREYCSTMMERLPKMDKLSNVSMANLVLLNNDFGSVNPDFNKAVSDYHNAFVKSMSFSKPEDVVEYSNRWAKQNTKGLVKNVLSKNDINPTTTAILSNALYFNGKWTSKFKKEKTGKEDFTLSNGATKKIDMMKLNDNMYFREFVIKSDSNGNSESVGWSVVRLMYGNGAFAMDLLLPNNEEDLSRIFSSIDNIPVSVPEWKTPKTDLWLPKFELKEMRINMDDILQNLGMKKIFSDSFHFFDNGISSSIDKVFQSTAIKVDESGTEAAAVTEIIHTYTGISYSEKTNTLDFHCDRPFLFTINETSTGAILFAGVFRGE